MLKLRRCYSSVARLSEIHSRHHYMYTGNAKRTFRRERIPGAQLSKEEVVKTDRGEEKDGRSAREDGEKRQGRRRRSTCKVIH